MKSNIRYFMWDQEKLIPYDNRGEFLEFIDPDGKVTRYHQHLYRTSQEYIYIYVKQGADKQQPELLKALESL